jgi:hypothetical protein
MRKAVTTFLVTVIVLSVMGVTVAAAASISHATALQTTSITITDYPKQVKAGQSIAVKGRLTSGGNGLGNKLIFGEWQDDNGAWRSGGSGYNTTSADGSFSFRWTINKWDNQRPFRQSFLGDNQYAPCVSAWFAITVTE